MRKFMEWMERRIGGGPGEAKRIQTFRWLMLIGLAGAAMVIMSSFLSVKTIEQTPYNDSPSVTADTEETIAGSKQSSAFEEAEHHYEQRIKEILEKIVGVGEVDVLVTVDSVDEIVVERHRRDSEQKTMENDKTGATRNITEISRNGEVVLYQVSGDQSPIVLKRIKPQVRGVLVVARGAENAVVKSLISQAVANGLNVPAHRISIVPRKQND